MPRMKQVAVPVLAAGLLSGFLFSLILPVRSGWENGWLENSQVLISLLAAFWCCGLYRRTSHLAAADRSGEPEAWRSLWLVAGLVWLLLAARELSWGAVFYPPRTTDELLGPLFPSSQHLPWKPLVDPALAILLAGALVVFFRHRLGQRLAQQWRRGNFPLVELLLGCLALVLASLAEGHLHWLPGWLNAGQQQLLEEWAELWGYLALVAAQWRLSCGFAGQGASAWCVLPARSL